jgi:transposase InsO family protein
MLEFCPGFCYTAFVTDVCTGKIVGWAVSVSAASTDCNPEFATCGEKKRR